MKEFDDDEREEPEQHESDVASLYVDNEMENSENKLTNNKGRVGIRLFADCWQRNLLKEKEID
jgi:hypothetical protein